jgi:iron complex outermembrane receptor protein
MTSSIAAAGRCRHGTLLIGLCLLSLSVAAEEEQRTATEAIEEIVVTAQKRVETLQEVAAAVTVVGADAIDVRGITTLAHVQNLLPSVRLQAESASTEIYIRGVGSTLDLPMIEPPNAYNINGVYVPREVTSATLVDVERIELLPGPQGTLYGRGAIGGVVNTITTRPGDATETRALLEAGDYGHARATVTQNVPLGAGAALRGSLSYIERDGYLKSGADSADDVAGFLALAFQPADSVDVHLWTHIEDRGGYAANLLSKGEVGRPKSQAFPNDNPWDDRLEGDLAAFATLGPIDAQDREWETVLVGAEIDWRLSDALSLTYIPSYLDFEWRQGYWLTHKDGDFNETIDQRTHELRLAYDAGGRLSALGGAYAYRIETAGQLFIQFGPGELFPGSPPGLWLGTSDVRDHELDGTAVFGELTYALSDRARWTVGARASRDSRKANGYQPDIVVAPAVDSEPVALFTGLAPPTWSNEDDWSHVDWKLAIEFDAGADTLLYAVAQTGFQPGTFDVFPDTVTAESELLALTVGAKNRLLDGRLLLNNELFHYSYDNLLVQSFDAATGTNRLSNADVTIYGDQLDLVYTPASLPDTRLSLSLAYLHARYDDFIVDSLDAFNGNQMQNAPDWTATLGIVRAWRLGGGARVELDLSSRYESSFWGDFSHSSGIYQEAYTKTDLALTYHAGGGRWSIGAWVRNLEDQVVQAAAATGNPLTDPGPGAPFIEAPRTYGLRLTWSSQ